VLSVLLAEEEPLKLLENSLGMSGHDTCPK
jgi:hypothetical protein